MGTTNPGIDTKNTSRLSIALADQNARADLFRLLVDSVRDYAIFMLDAGGHVATWNTGAERMTGYAANEIIGRHVSAFYPPDGAAAGKCDAALEIAAREGRFEEDGWRIRKDGGELWANVVIGAIRDRDGMLVGFSNVTRDLTERKRNEEARIAAEQRFRLLVDSVRDYAIFMLDTGGHVVTWNAGAERLKGYRAEEIIGRHFSTFYPPADAASGKCDLELELAARDGRFEDEGWRVRKDGSRFWANVVISGVRDSKGTLVGFSKVTRDLTERRRGEDERAARFAAERANRAKDEFLAMLGHELRNPLAPISTALQLLKLRGGPPSRELQVIERQLGHMLRLVDDLLDVSRIVQGKVELKRQRLDLREVIAKAIEIASVAIEQKEHRLDVEIPPGEWSVDGDEARLAQVFANLLVNAAKYTDPAGHIALVLRGERDEVVTEVTDDGSGIEAALLPRVFDLFVQGYQGVERSQGGLGLGLTLVRKLVERHGGNVEVRSPGPGKGSTFTVRLPRADAPATANPQEPTAPVTAHGHRRRVLIVDDNADALMVLGDLLAAAGHDVRTAGDPAMALAIARTFHPEVAILDIGLPVMDGYELATRLRAQAGSDPMQLIALTGYGQAADRARAEQAGFDAHFVKPVDLKRLIAALGKRS